MHKDTQTMAATASNLLLSLSSLVSQPPSAERNSMAFFQRMIRFSKLRCSSSINSLSSNSPTHRLNYGRLSHFVKPNASNSSCSFFSSNAFHPLNKRWISEIIKPDGKGGFLVERIGLRKSLKIDGVPVKDLDTITSLLEESLQYLSKAEKEQEHKYDSPLKDIGKRYENSMAALDEQQMEIDEFIDFLEEAKSRSTKSFVRNVITTSAAAVGLVVLMCIIR